MTRTILFVTLLLMGISLFSCESEDDDRDTDDDVAVDCGGGSTTNCDTTQVTLSGKIKPILTSRCYSCHSTQNASRSGDGIDVESYPSLKNLADNGSLLGSIEHASGFSPMPRGGCKLSTCEIEQIRIWIREGAQNN